MKDEDKTKEQLIKELIELRENNNEIKDHLKLLEKRIRELEVKQKLSEKALIATEERYGSFFENTIVGIYQSSLGGCYIIANSAFANIFGYDSSEELLSLVEAPQLYVNVEDRTKCIQEALEHGVGIFEIQVYRKDGSKAWILNYVRVVRDNYGNIVCFEGIAIDITRRKQVEEELNKYRQYLEEIVIERTSRELKTVNEHLKQVIIARMRAERDLFQLNNKINDILESITDAFLTLDHEWRFTYLNKKAEQTFGSNEHIIGKIIWECYPNLINTKIYEEYHKAMTEKVDVHFEVLGFYSKSVWYEVHVYSSKDGISVYFRDITERKQMEEALLKKHKQLQVQLSYASALNRIAETIIGNNDTRIILQTMADIIGSTLGVDRSLIFDIDFTKHQLIALCEWLNSETLNITATKGTYSRDIFINSTDFMMEHRKLVQSHVDDINPILISDGSAEVIHNQMHIKSVLWYPFSFREQGYFCLVFNQVNYCRIWRKEELEFIVAVTKQVEIAIQKINFLAEQKRAEEALRLSEERFYKAFNCSPVAMTIRSFDNEKFIDANESCLKIDGYSRDELIGRTPLELNLWVDMDERVKFRKDINEKGFAINHEISSYKKSGEIFTALLSGVVIDLNGEKCVLVIKNDITELRQYQKEMARLSKLNLIGEMAAGIAHEVRNPMTTVRGFLQLLGNKKEYVQYKEYHDLMIEELDRANSIITEFLSLARDKADHLEVRDLNSIIKTMYPLINADAMNSGKNVRLDFGNIPDLLLNEKETRQLLLNLVRNGLEAMDTGGCLIIKTFVKDKEVILKIKDQGKGIPDNLLEKLGTPFLTTKPDGTGLGLATCYSIAKRHNANIEVETGATGTTFYVQFKMNA